MSDHCVNLPTCGFFKKYFPINQAVCRSFLRDYCRGEMQDACQRKVWRQEHGAPPPDDMLPNGVTLPSLDD